MEEHSPARHTRLLWVWRAVAAVAVLLLIVWLSRFAEHEEQALQHWIGQLGYWAPVVFITLLVLCTVLGVPDTVFGVAAGALFGFWRGRRHGQLDVRAAGQRRFGCTVGIAVGWRTCRRMAPASR